MITWRNKPNSSVTQKEDTYGELAFLLKCTFADDAVQSIVNVLHDIKYFNSIDSVKCEIHGVNAARVNASSFSWCTYHCSGVNK